MQQKDVAIRINKICFLVPLAFTIRMSNQFFCKMYSPLFQFLVSCFDVGSRKNNAAARTKPGILRGNRIQGDFRCQVNGGGWRGYDPDQVRSFSVIEFGRFNKSKLVRIKSQRLFDVTDKNGDHLQMADQNYSF